LIGLVLIVFLLHSPEVEGREFGKLLGRNIYLDSLNSDIAGYSRFSLISPIAILNRTIYVPTTSAQIRLISKWMSASAFFPRTDLSTQYNFLFELYGNKSSSTINDASFFCELGIYRGGSELPFFNSSRSTFLPNSTFQSLLFQYQISQNVTVDSGDRIYLKVFLESHGAGSFWFSYDSRKCPSNFNDPSETRYMTSTEYSNTTAPTNYGITTGSLMSGTISSIATSDNAYLIFNSVNVSVKPTVEVWINGSCDFALPFIQPRIEFKTNVTVSYWIEAYNFTNGGYDSGIGQTMKKTGTSSTSDVTYYIYSRFDSTKYVSSTSREWKIRVKLNSTTVSGFQLSIDFIDFRNRWKYLSTTQTSSSTGFDQNVAGSMVGIRIGKLNTTNGEAYYDLDGGTFVAQVPSPDETKFDNNTYSISQTQNFSRIVVRVVYGGATNLLSAGGDLNAGGMVAVFMTEAFNDTCQLDSSIWNVFYYFRYFPDPLDVTYFQYGSSTRNSRIESFVWSVLGAKIWHDVAIWTENLLARSWISSATFSFFLNVRSWTTSSTFFLLLNTRSWITSATFDFLLNSRGWRDSSIWTNFLNTRTWNVISVWNFDLGRESTAFLIIPILLLVALVLAIFLLTRK
jgi:hypothetical protein